MTGPIEPYDPAEDVARVQVAPAEWRAVAAAWGAGGFLNALDELAKRSGDGTPESVLTAGRALRGLLEDFGLTGCRTVWVERAWRAEP